MLTERVATKAMPVLSFTTDCGDVLCLVDVVGDLLDKDDLVIATAVQPAAAPVPLLMEHLYVGTVAPAVEDVTQSDRLLADAVVSRPDVVTVEVARELTRTQKRSIRRKAAKPMVWSGEVRPSSPSITEEVPVVSQQVVNQTQAEQAQQPVPEHSWRAERESWRLELELTPAQQGAVIGAKGGVIKQLQQQHRARISIDKHTGYCTVRASTPEQADKAAEDVLAVAAASDTRRKGQQQKQQRERALRPAKARAMPLDEAHELLSCERRVKALRVPVKLRKIESTKARVASKDNWIEVTELKQLEMEAQYQQELDQLCKQKLPRDAQTLKVLKSRVAQERKAQQQ